MKRKNSVLHEELKRKNAHLDVIFKSLASTDDAELENIVKRLRRGEQFEDIANGIRSVETVPSVPANYSTGSGADCMDPSSPSNDEGEELDSGGERVDRAQNIQGPCVRPSSWTNVTEDDYFVLELIDLYFTWHHPFFHFFSEQRFRADFAAGSLANCSSLLVNAILATGCHYSDHREAREDPSDQATVGEHFCKEGKRIFERGGKRTITSIQALAIMAVRESGCGRDLMGRWYLSLAYRLVCDSSYNQILVPQQMQKNAIDEEAWRITFWGCYNLETCVNLTS